MQESRQILADLSAFLAFRMTESERVHRAANIERRSRRHDGRNDRLDLDAGDSALLVAGLRSRDRFRMTTGRVAARGGIAAPAIEGALQPREQANAAAGRRASRLANRSGLAANRSRLAADRCWRAANRRRRASGGATVIGETSLQPRQQANAATAGFAAGRSTGGACGDHGGSTRRGSSSRGRVRAGHPGRGQHEQRSIHDN